MKHDLCKMPLLPLAHPDVYQLLPGAVTAFFWVCPSRWTILEHVGNEQDWAPGAALGTARQNKILSCLLTLPSWPLAYSWERAWILDTDGAECKSRLL